jgi:hypothetical protein
MLRKLSGRLTYANVMATVGVFIALGGSAYAVNTVNSSDITDGQVKSVDVGDGEIKSADVKDQSLTTFDVSTFLGADVVDGTLTGADVGDNSLTGADIDESSLVGLEDDCPPTMTLFLPLCARSDGVARSWSQALEYCKQFDLRPPSVVEAMALGAGYDVPGVANGEFFWTETYGGGGSAFSVNENGNLNLTADTGGLRTVCVTPPSSLYQ